MRRLGLGAGHARQRAGQHEGLAGERVPRRGGLGSVFCQCTPSSRRRWISAALRAVGEEARHALGDGGADALDRLELLLGGRGEGIEVAEVGRQQVRHALAHVPDAERDRESARAWCCLARSRLSSRLSADFSPMRSRPASGLALEVEEVGEARHEAALHELVDELLAEALDVERPAARQVAQVVLELGGAVEVRAARDHLALEAHASPPGRRGSAWAAR